MKIGDRIILEPKREPAQYGKLGEIVAGFTGPAYTIRGTVKYVNGAEDQIMFDRDGQNLPVRRSAEGEYTIYGPRGAKLAGPFTLGK